MEVWPIKVDASKGGVGDEYLSKFPTGKVPALERPNGFELYECIAVSVYRKSQVASLIEVVVEVVVDMQLYERINVDDRHLVAKQDGNTSLLGKSLEEEATILK